MPHGKPSKRAAEWSRMGSRTRHQMRLAIIERDGTKCRHCGRPTREPNGKHHPLDMTIDHWPIPKRRLPKSQWLDPSRAVIACLECNRRLNYLTQVGVPVC